MSTFENRTAVVTDGASGIGQALCEELARRGTTVVVAEINGHRAREITSAIASQGRQAESAEVDVADANQLERLVDQTVSRHGRLDYFFNNAAFGVVGFSTSLRVEAAGLRQEFSRNLNQPPAA